MARGQESSYAAEIERVIAVMRERLGERLTLRDLATYAHLSPYHFARMFQRVTGVPPAEYLAALRLQQAKRLLLTTDASVTDVCYRVGYASLGTFTTRFTRLVGISPGRLRHLAADGMPAPALPPTTTTGTRLALPCDITAGTRHWLNGDAGVTGSISLHDRAVPVFVGLFPSPVPQGRPTAMLLAAPGPFRISHIPDGRYYALAIALSPLDVMAACLLDGADLLVDFALAPILVHDGRANSRPALAPRPPQPIDPPIPIALPLLLRDIAQDMRSAN